MSNKFYNMLKAEVGEPTKTERVYMGLSAARIDYFPCGCQHIYIARTVAGKGEHEERLELCPKHKQLQSFRPEPEAQLQPRMF